jgi:hypothetical protein
MTRRKPVGCFRLWLSALSLTLFSSICIFAYAAWDSFPGLEFRINRLIERPEPQPDFIAGLGSGFISPFADTMCFSIWAMFPLVKDGSSGSYFLFRNTSLWLDGKKITATPISHMDYLLLQGELDSQGNFVNTRGGPLETCYELPLSEGLHLASIEIKSFSGKIYTYRWVFNIQSHDSTLYAKANTATFDAASTNIYQTIAAEAATHTTITPVPGLATYMVGVTKTLAMIATQFARETSPPTVPITSTISAR